jgi:hypothetical protein
VIDEVVPEPPGGAHRAPEKAMAAVREAILRALRELALVPLDALLERRLRKYRHVAAISGRFPTVGAEARAAPAEIGRAGLAPTTAGPGA